MDKFWITLKRRRNRNMKCNTVGCNEEATRHSKVDIGYGMFADIWSCEKHHKETVKSVNEAF